jgi:hypothetical protein
MGQASSAQWDQISVSLSGKQLPVFEHAIAGAFLQLQPMVLNPSQCFSPPVARLLASGEIWVALTFWCFPWKHPAGLLSLAAFQVLTFCTDPSAAPTCRVLCCSFVPLLLHRCSPCPLPFLHSSAALLQCCGTFGVLVLATDFLAQLFCHWLTAMQLAVASVSTAHLPSDHQRVPLRARPLRAVPVRSCDLEPQTSSRFTETALLFTLKHHLRAQQEHLLSNPTHLPWRGAVAPPMLCPAPQFPLP